MALHIRRCSAAVGVALLPSLPTGKVRVSTSKSGAGGSGYTTPCKVTRVILHAVVFPRRMTGVTLHGVVSLEGGGGIGRPRNPAPPTARGTTFTR